MPNEYKKSITQINAQQQQPTHAATSELESTNNQGYTREFC